MKTERTNDRKEKKEEKRQRLEQRKKVACVFQRRDIALL